MKHITSSILKERMINKKNRLKTTELTWNLLNLLRSKLSRKPTSCSFVTIQQSLLGSLLTAIVNQSHHYFNKKYTPESSHVRILACKPIISIVVGLSSHLNLHIQQSYNLHIQQPYNLHIQTIESLAWKMNWRFHTTNNITKLNYRSKRQLSPYKQTDFILLS